MDENNHHEYMISFLKNMPTNETKNSYIEYLNDPVKLQWYETRFLNCNNTGRNTATILLKILEHIPEDIFIDNLDFFKILIYQIFTGPPELLSDSKTWLSIYTYITLLIDKNSISSGGINNIMAFHNLKLWQQNIICIFSDKTPDDFIIVNNYNQKD